MPEKTEVPKKTIPVVKWDRAGRVTEPKPDSRERKLARQMAHLKLTSQRSVDRFLDRAEEAQTNCCKLAEVFEQEFPDAFDDCCARNQCALMMLLAADRRI